jgi:hypothetical protein
MLLLLRHPVSLVIVLVAMATTMSVFVFARPQYRPQFENPPFDMTKEHVYSRAEVRGAFAQHGLRLRYVTQIGGHDGGVTTYATGKPPWDTKQFYVYYAGPKAQGSWGDPDIAKDGGEYEQRFGNLLVHYGGSDEQMLARIEAAVDDLR